MGKPQNPVLDLLIMKDGGAWRLLLSPQSWQPGLLRDRLDARREIYPVANPGAADLDRFMWETDSPYIGGATADGGLHVLARGRSAITLLVWLEEVVRGG